MSNKKTLVYWIGLILLGLSVWVSFIALWIFVSMYYPDYWRFGGASGPVILIVGAMIFAAIGLRMMREGVYDEFE